MADAVDNKIVSKTGHGSSGDELPIVGLLALAASGFITILTEALPAGLLPQIGRSLDVTESLAGQLVTTYAIGSLAAAIPLTNATRGWRRRNLLIIAIFGFAIVNLITALSVSYALTLVARFFAGVFAGLLWALLAGYAGRMVPDHLRGRAIAIAMVGTPLALSIGVPSGTFLGAAIGWRYTFGFMSALAASLIVLILWKVPDFPGEIASNRRSLKSSLMTPGLIPILFVTLTFVLTHNILYTYIAPILAAAGVANRVDTVLLVFGISALLGIWVVGSLVDKWLRKLVLGSIVLFGVSGVAIGVGLLIPMPTILYVGIVAWGLSFGGAATLFQTASANVAGDSADIAQSMVVTAWNIAIAAGGVLGAVLIEAMTVSSLPWAAIIILMLTFFTAWQARDYCLFSKKEKIGNYKQPTDT